MNIHLGWTCEGCAFVVFHWMFYMYKTVSNWEIEQVLSLPTPSVIHNGGDFRDTESRSFKTNKQINKKKSP